MEKFTAKSKRSGLKYWMYLVFGLLVLSTGISGLKEKPALQERIVSQDSTITFQATIINRLNDVITELGKEVQTLRSDLHLVRHSTMHVSKLHTMKAIRPDTIKVEIPIPLTEADSMIIYRDVTAKLIRGEINPIIVTPEK